MTLRTNTMDRSRSRTPDRAKSPLSSDGLMGTGRLGEDWSCGKVLVYSSRCGWQHVDGRDSTRHVNSGIGDPVEPDEHHVTAHAQVDPMAVFPEGVRELSVIRTVDGARLRDEISRATRSPAQRRKRTADSDATNLR